MRHKNATAMNRYLIFLLFFAAFSLVFADTPFVVPKNASFLQNTQIKAKEVRFEVDETSRESHLKVNADTYLSIECDHLILDGTVTFQNTTSGDNVNGIKIEILYKTLSGPGKIANGITGFNGNVTFIFTQVK